MKSPRLWIGGESRVEMIPLIDVVFLVLVAFIYASAFLSPTVGLPVELPRTVQGEADRAPIVTVTIERDGSLYLGDQAISVTELPEYLTKAKQRNMKTSVYVKADRQAQIAPLVRVLDIAREIEMTGLTIATRKQAKSPQPER